MSTDIAKADEQRLAAFGGMMDETPVSGADILMPALLLMQPVSGMVTKEKARSGEWRGSLAENLVVPKEQTTEVVPFGFHKTWVVFKKDRTGKQDFVRVEPFSVRPIRERAEVIEGVEYQNFETINYFVMLAAEMANPTALPYLLRFRSTGFIVGKKMETMRAQLQKAHKPHCFSTFKLGSLYKENDKGKFYIPTLDWGRPTTDEELSALKPWVELAKSGKAKADESDLAREREVDVSGGDSAEVVDMPAAGKPGFQC